MRARNSLLALLAAAGLLATGCGDQPVPPMLVQTAALAEPIACDGVLVAQVVEQFGEQMKHVSVLDPDSVAARNVRQHYGALVEPQLLEMWASAPARAPGRMGSSTWPDRIDILTIPAPDGEDCQVDGEVVYASSISVTDQGSAWREPVTAHVRLVGDVWLITGFRHRIRSRTGGLLNASLSEPTARPDTETSYPNPDTLLTTTPRPQPVSAEVPSAPVAESAPVTTPAPAPPPVSREARFGFDEAAEVVRQYYSAIDGRDYRRAYALWADGGAASRKTYEQFSTGFAETETVQVTVGKPARSAKQGGGTYVDVPVTIRALTTSGARQEFQGRYTVRQAEEGRWHLDSARIRVVR